MNDYAQSQLDQASLFAGMKLIDLVNFVSEIEPELNRIEATILTGVFLEQLLILLPSHPDFIKALKHSAQSIKDNRNDLSVKKL